MSATPDSDAETVASASSKTPSPSGSPNQRKQATAERFVLRGEPDDRRQLCGDELQHRQVIARIGAAILRIEDLDNAGDLALGVDDRRGQDRRRDVVGGLRDIAGESRIAHHVTDLDRLAR